MALTLNPTASVTDSVTVSATGGPYTISVPWVTTTGTDTSITLDPNWSTSTSTSSKIRLDGPEADIEINGESMIDMLRRIEQRLNILTPNPELESEWEELRALGEQYRALEKHIEEKMKTWQRLSQVNRD